MTKGSWQEKAAKKRQEVRSEIPPSWLLPQDETSKFSETTPVSVLDLPRKYLDEKELHITEDYSPKQLLQKLADGGFTAVEVVEAFSHRSAIATQVTNCCTEIMFSYGLERAKFLDGYLVKHGKPFGPLHGLPISLKDSTNVPGYDSTIGYTGFIGNASSIKDYQFVDLILSLGAVPFVKTNIPHTLMTLDSENNIFGRTLNPNKLTLTAGGSSGGEGSLIKQRGSLVGFGTDIGGSIRIPAYCNGVYGLRSTVNRIPNVGGTDPSRDYFVGVDFTTGPLAVDLEGIELVTKAIIESEACSKISMARAVPWRPVEVSRPLRIGSLVPESRLPIHPPLKRILKEAEQKLRAQGHEIVPIEKYPSAYDSWKTIMGLFLADPESTAISTILDAGEPLINSLTDTGVKAFRGAPESIAELIELKAEAYRAAEDWHGVFDDNNLDCIIGPGAPGAAPPHDSCIIAPFTAQWNLVDFPALVIPYGKVEDTDEVEPVDKGDLADCFAFYEDKNAYLGAPGHIQIVTKHLHDEKLLSCAKIIEQALVS
ncbi:amidase [Yamadazyma tenuis]|uniref:Amidase n=1 Tax=Candida tenuis (strain ATCC 10573 / BCRC 21748 / CBS 615 / JCM 9827 / NBRC 10315 / NRRL Y-1498 / VKM Y-70) TaxID=590646 RepID=G3B0Q2_CANTC|nr:amidase [Yamadazyma tenuis ATCC 10573]EGV65445.1 amidase [Yamadazyma tenuis ATCC 10573]WEJ94872.1 amidase [Yamadazyma tenuis]